MLGDLTYYLLVKIMEKMSDHFMHESVGRQSNVLTPLTAQALHAINK